MTGADQRGTLQAASLVCIWVYFISTNGVAQQRINYVQVVGYLLLLFGVFMYNEVIVLPFCGLNENTMDKKDEKAKERRQMIEEYKAGLYTLNPNSIDM